MRVPKTYEEFIDDPFGKKKEEIQRYNKHQRDMEKNKLWIE